uniref:Venom protein n=1 Tax=Strongyloides venezuelensis TaxID=75913 RepID=A0A0K0FI62_STRVS
MKIIYLILAFAILCINADDDDERFQPFYRQVWGYCNKEICVSTCGGDDIAECERNWTFLLIFKNGLCRCYPRLGIDIR